jgi:hypothetical protein
MGKNVFGFIVAAIMLFVLAAPVTAAEKAVEFTVPGCMD